MNHETQIRSILAEAWNVAPEEIPADAALGKYRPWDSLGHVGVLLSLSQAFGFELDVQRVQQLNSYQAICAFISEYAPVAPAETAS